MRSPGTEGITQLNNPATTCALLVPCRNGADFLERLADDAKRQTRPFDELWLFDDASSDHTGRIARDLGFQVIRSDVRIGPGAARNRLAEATDAEWIHFHDADDRMAPTYLEKALDRVAPDVDFVVTDMRWFDAESGRELWDWRYCEESLRRSPLDSVIRNTFGGINVLYRKTRFQISGGFDETLKFWEELDLAVRLFSLGAACRVVNTPLITALRRPDSLSNSNKRTVWNSKVELLCRIFHEFRTEVADAVAEQSELSARKLWLHKDYAGMRRALDLCRAAGGSPPASRHPAIRILERILPNDTVFRIHARISHMRKTRFRRP